MTILQRKPLGFSLIELMLGITLSLVLTIILSTILINNTNTIHSTDIEHQLQRTALYAQYYLSRHIKHSAYFGDTQRKAALTGTALPTNLLNPNATCENAEWTRKIGQPLTGTNQNQRPYPCLNSRTSLRQSAGDTITVRYSSQFATKSYSKNTLYARSSLSTIALFSGKDRRIIENNIPPPYTDRKFNSFTFYISRSKQNWCRNVRVPVLTTMSRSRSGKLRRSATIAGIEQMQIQYSSDFITFIDADKVTNWRKIKICKVWLLVRSLCRYYKQTRHYQLQIADMIFQSNDRFRRKLSIFTIAFRNNATD